MTECKTELSLRERRQVETWTQIHEAALDLALADGLAAATIDAIADRAGISRRTFFNYFPSKEDALLGLRAPQLSDEVRERFRISKEPTLLRLTRLVRGTVRETSATDKLGRTADMKRRKELVHAHPELALRMKAHMGAVSEMLTKELERAEREVAAGLEEPLGDGLTHEDAEAAIMLANSILLHAFKTYGESALHRDSDAIIHSLETFRNLLESK
ncbi:TetR family transcriptional regulator [Neomicrococcus aestuarii]|uniref:HTH tetR-type domain-containing protein n=1 Tax=Neomicrococcus aestuarii TaxID=556325 RepID=A0A1L2ZQ60_9MICC|nr:TetR family transcriptional regulator [Neomicrococcus aestuarii]APF41132.1 hypothetical protein BHE16_09130 [Neomicrococcus aestuarii]